MTAAKWSYTRPILAGWYWWQVTPDSPPEVVKLIYTASGWMWIVRGGEFDGRSGNEGRWSGPIPSPDGMEPWEKNR